MTIPRQHATKQHQREACAMLLGSEGWRSLLAYVVERLSLLDNIIYEPSTPDNMIQQSIGQHKALQGIVEWVCGSAGVKSPFDTYRMALWSTLAPPAPTPVEADASVDERQEELTEEQKRDIREQARRLRNRGGGGIA